jgi:signal transduction histidine kinase
MAVVGSASRGLGWLVLVVAVPLVFPDGRTAWPARRWPVALCAVAVGAFVLGTLLAPVPLDFRLAGTDSPTGLPPSLSGVADLLALGAIALCLVTLVVAVAGLVRRWRGGDELQRQQLLWFTGAFAAPVALLPLIATPFVDPWMFAVVTLPVPVAVAVALLQRRLYDIQLVVSRSLAYVVLSVLIACLYAATVGGVGALLQERGADWLPWVAAGVVAVSFAPLRDALQRAANRLVYGRWAQPAEVLATTGRRLTDAMDVTRLLGTLAQELGDGLGLRGVEVVDARGARLAGHGVVAEPADEVPLTAYGRPVGVLRWHASDLRTLDRQLLHDVAHQLGAVVHAAGLLDAVRLAQERLVLAREEERRRLRRELHDGLGSALAGLTLQVDTLRNQLAASAVDPDAELVRLRSGIQATVLEVRRIVEGLRPPAVDELGLEGAVRQLVDRVTTGTDLVVDVDTDVGCDVAVDPGAEPGADPAAGSAAEPAGPRPIPAAVEVAAYRVAQEALTNVVRHAHARRAAVRARLDRAGLTLEVVDDGVGGARERPGGAGLVGMRERAEEVGGSLVVESPPGAGTTVTLHLPLDGLAADGPVGARTGEVGAR